MSVPTVSRISPADLDRRMKEENLLVIDVRESCIGGKVPGAVNVPASQFESQLSVITDYIKSADSVVVHCMRSVTRGPKCAEFLDTYLASRQDITSKILVLDGGFQGWVEHFQRSDPSKIESFDREAFEAEQKKH